MKSIANTFLFQITNKIIDYEKNLKNVLSPANILKNEDIDYFIDIIDRRFNFGMKNAVIGDFKKELLIPVFNKLNIHLPTYIPVIGRYEDGTPIVYVNLTHYGFFNKEKKFEIDSKKLYALLQVGYILRNLIQLPTRKISLNLNLAKSGSFIFSSMMTKLLDKMFALSIDPPKHDMVRFLTSKFFIINMLEKGEEGLETTNNVAFNNTQGYITKNIAQNIEFDDIKNYENIDTFLQSLNNINNIKNLNTRLFLHEWIKMFGEASLMSLEYFPFFLYTVFSSFVNANIANDYIIEPLCGKDLNVLYNEITKILRNQ